MGSRGLHKVVRKAISEMLQAGEFIKPDEIVERFEMEINDSAARNLWARTYVARMVHDEARSHGLIAVSCGASGYKVVETEEEMELAKARAYAQIKGQSTRGKRLIEKLRTLNQLTFPLQEVMADVGTDAEPKPAKTASA